jgi:Na+/proline symporter
VIAIATGNSLSPNNIVLVMTVAFLLYSFFGGLVASAYTNMIQAVLIIILSMLLIPLGLHELGGFTALRDVLPADFFKVYSSKSGMSAFNIAMLSVNGIVGITSQPHMLTMCATGNKERSGRVGQTYGSFVKRLCTIGWALVGLIVAALVIKDGIQLKDPEMAFGYGCRRLLLPGLTGLMVSAIVAANMSACSNYMVNTGALFTENVYKKYFNPIAEDKKILRIGRFSGLILSLLAVVFALTIKNVLNAFLFTETIAAFVGIIFLGGVLWRRANRHGALAAIVISFAVYYILNYLHFNEILLVYKWHPGLFGWAMLAGSVAFILASLLTRPENKEAMDEFFNKMRLSTDPEDKNNDGTKMPASDAGKDLLLLDITGWIRPERWKGFFVRYREDLGGFLLSWGFVAALILLAWAIMQIS